MSHSKTEELKIKAKLLLKEKRKSGDAEFTLARALDHMAAKLGHADWRAYKQTLENDLFCPPHFSARLNTWYSTHGEAAAHLAKHPDEYLLPYRAQFFICLPDYIEALVEFWGIAPDDPDLALVGHDWAQPADKAAMSRLRDKIKPSA